MNIAKFLARKATQLENEDHLTFTRDELESLRADEVQHVIDYFHGYTLMKLPAFEIEFFEWLKANDPLVWDDLWGDEENLYLVSTDLLSEFVGSKPQFPICELVDQPNFWFTERHIKPKGREALEEILLKLENREAIHPDEAFLLEVAQGPTDVWHFCYRHRLSLTRMKQLIEEMALRGWLVHLKNREDLVRYIDI
ncbi:MAG TPA: hypothetical protein ENJ89_01845 [Caldithrix abyssi]|uniref:Uncharacterized protein n=1 Tax=Caldithrix abyssi TaxID=187145 RepID=A0A7V5UDZ8_CALAY|nr:hypothetical protein [Caldithrix abyssi]